MSPGRKPPPIVENFNFGPVTVEVSMLSNHRDYRIWQAWFGKKGSAQRYWASFKLTNGIWFGPMAYYVVARTIASDLEIALNAVKVGQRAPGFPQAQNLDVYAQRVDYLSRTIDIYDEVPVFLAAVTSYDTLEDEDTTPEYSLHNARSLILDNRIPDTVALAGSIDETLEVVASWMTDKTGFSHLFQGFRYGKKWDLVFTLEFFSMIGYYNSDFKSARFVTRRKGPKEWSPYKHVVYLERGKDYAKEDFQPGEHDL